MRKEIFVLDPNDNVATLIGEGGQAGKTLEFDHRGAGLTITLRQDIPFGHKFALGSIKKGERVVKYGHNIGTASRDIEIGDHVHIHNLDSNRGRAVLGVASPSIEKDTHQ